MTKTVAITSPVSRYPGSKRLFLKGLLKDAPNVQAVIEPFAGAGHYAIARLAEGVDFAFFGEVDPTVRALYEVWARPDLHYEFLEAVAGWKRFFADQESIAWQTLNERMENKQEAEHTKVAGVRRKIKVVDDAATGAVLRQLTLAGIVRKNGKGRQNAPLVADQLNKLASWQPALYGSDLAKRIEVVDAWQGAIARFEASNLFSAEAFVDPPYYVPREDCPIQKTATYWNHQPHEESTLYLCLDAAYACAQDARIERIMVTNYMSKVLDTKLHAIARDCARKIERIDGDALRGMQRKTARGDADAAKQCFWELT